MITWSKSWNMTHTKGAGLASGGSDGCSDIEPSLRGNCSAEAVVIDGWTQSSIHAQRRTVDALGEVWGESQNRRQVSSELV